MAEPVDFFIHIPKTAGTTMTHIIEAQYPRGSVWRLNPRDLDEQMRRARLAAIGPEIRCVSAHFHAGYATAIPRLGRSFTLLRSPTERVISLYFYIAREQRHRAHEAFQRGEITVEAVARRQRRVQACYVAGIGIDDPMDDAELLARARHHLEHTIAAFGLTERFDESLVLFNHSLGWKVRGYVRANVTRDRPQESQLTPGDLAIFREHNSVDQSLYDFAAGLFEKRLAAQPAGFAAQVAALRRSAAIQGRLAGLRSSLATLRRRLLPG